MANFNPLIKPKAHVDRNGFDLSQNHKFTAKPGMLLPILSIDCVPNDYHEIDVMSLMKTMPVNTDAFVRAKQHFEFYFVPYSQMWSNWHNFIVQNQSERNTVAVQPSSFNVPSIRMSDLISEIGESAEGSAQSKLDFMGMEYQKNAIRLCDLLGYGYYAPMTDDADGTIDAQIPAYYNSRYVNPFRIGAYNKIWYDYYRNKWYDNDSRYIYGWNFDDVQPLDSSMQSCDISQVRHDITQQDGLYVAQSTFTDTSMYYPLFTMHYRQWKKDLFMSLMPSQQFGAVSAVDLQFAVDGHVFGSNSVANGHDFTLIGQTSEGRITSNSDNGVISNFLVHTSGNSQFDVYALRKAEVLQKWKESTLRAGASASSQYRAHYGSDSKWIDKDTCEFIGSVSSDIEINPIYSTAATDGAPLGEIAGRGQSFSSGKTIKYKADDFGVLMCIYSILPECEYDSMMVDKNNTLFEPFDFFTPEFEDLGLQPVQSSDLSLYTRPWTTTPHESQFAPTSSVLGYTSRYFNYKTAVDKLHGQFMSVGSDYTKFFNQTSGSLTSWTIPRADILYSSNNLQLNNFYVNPFCDKTIFASWGVSDMSDNFLVNAYFDIKSVRPMSVLGLPQW